MYIKFHPTLLDFKIAAIILEHDHNPYLFIIDTGSTLSYIDKDSFKDVIDPSLLQETVTDVIGVANNKITLDKALELSFFARGLSFKSNFYFADYSILFQAVEDITGIRPAGILGTDFLIKYDANISFKNNYLQF